jgi:hypothetical protein
MVGFLILLAPSILSVIRMEFDVTSISAIVAAVGVVVGMIVTVQELRHLRKQRQTDLLVRLAPWLSISSGELLQAYVKVLNLEFKGYDDFVEKYGQPLAEKPEQMAIMTVGNYFEAVGTLLRKRLLDLDLVWEYWGETFLTLWQRKYKVYVEGVRKEFNQPEFGDAGEYLYEEMRKREQQLAKIQ